MTFRVPTNVRAINGNPGKQGLKPTGEPDPAYLDDLTPPPFLTCEKAREVWTYLAPKLRADRLLCEVDVITFARFCEDVAECWITQQMVSDQLAEGKMPVRFSEKGGISYDPAYTVRNRAAERVDKGIGHFGMSPMARTKIRSNPQTDLFGGASAIEDYLDQIRAA
jgi:P27 family predicted phage terminase small subunit